jgi:hypothetical protein
MCPTRIEIATAPIELDLSDVFSFERGFGRANFLATGQQAEEIQSRLTADLLAKNEASPRELLDDYKTTRRRSLLGQILGAAKRLRDAVDRVVLLGSAQSIESAKMLFAACCHPFHNELSRGQRGGRPRIYFCPVVPDNDQIYGLLEILPRHPSAIIDCWGILATDGDSNRETLSGLFHLFWDVLQAATSSDEEAERTVVVAEDRSVLATLANEIGLPRLSPGPRNQILGVAPLDSGVLLAASVMGLDIVKLLRGAAEMIDRFANQPLGNNPALDLAVVGHLLWQRRNISERIVESRAAALQPLAARFSTIGKNANQSIALLIQLLSDSVRADRLRVTMPAGEKKTAERYLTDISADESKSLRELRKSMGLPTAVIRVRVVDDFAVGQLIALFSIVSAAQQQLTGG